VKKSIKKTNSNPDFSPAMLGYPGGGDEGADDVGPDRISGAAGMEGSEDCLTNLEVRASLRDVNPPA